MDDFVYTGPVFRHFYGDAINNLPQASIQELTRQSRLAAGYGLNMMRLANLPRYHVQRNIFIDGQLAVLSVTVLPGFGMGPLVNAKIRVDRPVSISRKTTRKVEQVTEPFGLFFYYNDATKDRKIIDYRNGAFVVEDADDTIEFDFESSVDAIYWTGVNEEEVAVVISNQLYGAYGVSVRALPGDYNYRKVFIRNGKYFFVVYGDESLQIVTFNGDEVVVASGFGSAEGFATYEVDEINRSATKLLARRNFTNENDDTETYADVFAISENGALSLVESKILGVFETGSGGNNPPIESIYTYDFSSVLETYDGWVERAGTRRVWFVGDEVKTDAYFGRHDYDYYRYQWVRPGEGVDEYTRERNDIYQSSTTFDGYAFSWPGEEHELMLGATEGGIHTCDWAGSYSIAYSLGSIYYPKFYLTINRRYVTSGSGSAHVEYPSSNPPPGYSCVWWTFPYDEEAAENDYFLWFKDSKIIAVESESETFQVLAHNNDACVFILAEALKFYGIYNDQITDITSLLNLIPNTGQILLPLRATV